MGVENSLADAFAVIERQGGTVEVVRMQPEVQKGLGLGDILTQDSRGLNLWGAQVVLDESLSEPFKVYTEPVPAVCTTCERPF